MSDFIPKAGTIKVGGLSRAAQKLQAAKDKAAGKAAGTPGTGRADTAVKANSTAGHKKTSFQRKAV